MLTRFLYNLNTDVSSALCETSTINESILRCSIVLVEWHAKKSEHNLCGFIQGNVGYNTESVIHQNQMGKTNIILPQNNLEGKLRPWRLRCVNLAVAPLSLNTEGSPSFGLAEDFWWPSRAASLPCPHRPLPLGKRVTPSLWVMSWSQPCNDSGVCFSFCLKGASYGWWPRRREWGRCGRRCQRSPATRTDGVSLVLCHHLLHLPDTGGASPGCQLDMKTLCQLQRRVRF